MIAAVQSKSAASLLATKTTDKEVCLASTTATDLAQALQRHGDDLYRLACLLTPNAALAERALLDTTRRLAASPPGYDEPALIGALLAALPREHARPSRQLPEWAQPPAGRERQQPLLAAIARLPRATRATLGLSILRSFEPRQVAAATGAEATEVPAQLRDALLALAPAAPTERPTEILRQADPPEACRATRSALALADPRLHSDPSLRAHLASCSACRSAELAWLQLSAAVEEALRGALRETRQPARLAAQLQLLASAPAGSRPSWRDDPRARIALVALPVLLIIAALVWPRGGGGSPTGSGGASTAPAELVRRALAQLYTPAAGEGVWYGQYEIAWVFPNNTTALLNAELWRELGTGRHRAQLVHHDGGGPYEFELADDHGALWYAVSPNYLRALTPVEFGTVSLRNAYRVTPEQREQMLAARLDSGAWALAGAYLRQAGAAELRSWGRQRDPGGRQLQLVSFAGVSPLALPADAPEATSSHVTVLLAIDEASGRLREVRELFGAEGAEQTTRVTWRAVAEELLPAPTPTINDMIDQPIFDLRRAWNGTGTFATRGTLRIPQMPLIEDIQIGSLSQLLQDMAQSFWLPTPPPDTKAALLLNLSQSGQSLVYLGERRQLSLAPVFAPIELGPDGDLDLTPFASSTFPAFEQAGGDFVAFKPLPAQGYMAQYVRVDRANRRAQALLAHASGYTRAELLAVLKTLAPPTPASFSQLAPLFVETHAHDEAWRALVGALAAAPEPPAGGARHFVEQVFKRQQPLADPLADPYHRPPYGGWPERYLQDNWSRTNPLSDTLESAASTRSLDGGLLGRQYRGGLEGWDYDANVSRVTMFDNQPLAGVNEDQGVVLRMLDCGGAQLLRRPDGARALTLTERSWQANSCQNPHYPQLWLRQLDAANANSNAQGDIAPFLLDMTGDTLTTMIVLGADGRPERIEVWVGAPDSGTLLESWQRISEELVPAEQLPADTFDPTPPDALLRWLVTGLGQVSYQPPVRFDLASALQRAQSPLFGFAPGDRDAELLGIEASPTLQSLQPPVSFSDEELFEQMVFDGIAIRSTTMVTTTAGENMLLTLFQAPAEQARAFLRDQTRWASSEPTRLQIGERSVDGWLVRTQALRRPWLLFELDGTLLATPNPSEDGQAALGRLVRLQ